MTNPRAYRFVPDVPIPPGETVSELLSDRHMSQADFALALGRTEKNVSQLVNGKAPITHELAIDLERVLGVPAAVWNNLESTYRDLLARRREEELLADESDWVRQFPLKRMQNEGFIARETSPARQTAEVLRFFGVASRESWTEYWASPKRLAARMTTAYTANVPALTVWLRQGELLAREVDTASYDATRFAAVVQDARRLTRDDIETAIPELTESCARAGVALVLVPELPRIRCSGVSRWVSPNKAIIQLCLRYKTHDQLWFSFFHEAGHILKHDRKHTYVQGLADDSIEEIEADAFAADTLIPRADWVRFVAAGRPTKQEVLGFARQEGIAEGIVVGRLQKERLIPFSWMNDLKVRLDWVGTSQSSG